MRENVVIEETTSSTDAGGVEAGEREEPGEAALPATADEAAGEQVGDENAAAEAGDEQATGEAGDEQASGDQPAGDEQAEPEVIESDAERIARLEREGDVAADYLEELLDIADVDGDIDLDIEGDRAIVAIVGEGLQRLVGRDGEVLDALQDLTRLAVLRETNMRSRLMLDIGGHRARRRGEILALAEKIADEVLASGEPARLDPMTPFERKIVHDTVAAKGLTSESEGEEPQRRVVVQPVREDEAAGTGE